jgi:hypothetical protein
MPMKYETKCVTYYNIHTLYNEIKNNKMNCELMLTYDTPALRQAGSRNLMSPKTLPTIWGTYMKLVRKYQIPVINSYWEKCDKKCAYIYICSMCIKIKLSFYTHWTYKLIFRRIFLSNYWGQKSGIWSQASYMYAISWESFLDPSDS